MNDPRKFHFYHLKAPTIDTRKRTGNTSLIKNIKTRSKIKTIYNQLSLSNLRILLSITQTDNFMINQITYFLSPMRNTWPWRRFDFSGVAWGVRSVRTHRAANLGADKLGHGQNYNFITFLCFWGTFLIMVVFPNGWILKLAPFCSRTAPSPPPPAATVRSISLTVCRQSHACDMAELLCV